MALRAVLCSTAALVVAALIDTVGVAPLVTDIGELPETLVTPEPAEIPKFVRAFAFCVEVKFCEEVSILNLFVSAVLIVATASSSSFNPSASSAKVFNVPGAPFIKLVIAASTYLVVAARLLFPVPAT